MKYLKYVVILFVFFSSCNIPEPNPTYIPPVNDTTNQTNTTQTQSLEKQSIVSGYTNFFIFNSKECMFIITKNNQSIIVNCGSEDYLSNIKKIRNIGYMKTDYLVITKPSNSEYIEKIVMSFRPSSIYETGIPSPNVTYKTLNISNISMITDETNIEEISLIPNYKGGFVTPLESNSIIISSHNFASMSGSFTNEPPLVEKYVILLANSGNCQTNNVDFLIKANPSRIITNGELCESIKKDVELLGLVVYNLKDKDIQIISNETWYKVI